MSAGLTLLIIVAGAAVQYGLAVAGEEERKNRRVLQLAGGLLSPLA